MSDEFRIAETNTFIKTKSNHEFEKIYKKLIGFVYPQLRKNPFFGPNIKKLKGKLSQIYRYRIGIYRLFYIIDLEQMLVIVLSLKKRKDLYK